MTTIRALRLVLRRFVPFYAWRLARFARDLHQAGCKTCARSPIPCREFFAAQDREYQTRTRLEATA